MIRHEMAYRRNRNHRDIRKDVAFDLKLIAVALFACSIALAITFI